MKSLTEGKTRGMIKGEYDGKSKRPIGPPPAPANKKAHFLIMNKKAETICGFKQLTNGRDSVGRDCLENCQLNDLIAVNVPKHSYDLFAIKKTVACKLDALLNELGYYPY
jgi:hypothetical protein